MNPYEQHLADLERQREILSVANAAERATREWADEQRGILFEMMEKFPMHQPTKIPCHCPGTYTQDYYDGSYGPMYQSGRDWSPNCPLHGKDNPHARH